LASRQFHLGLCVIWFQIQHPPQQSLSLGRVLGEHGQLKPSLGKAGIGAHRRMR
jgi:hypothetical protein